MKSKFDRVARLFRSSSMLATGLILIGPSPSALSQSDTALASRPPRPYPTPPPFEENDITFIAPWNGEILGTGARRPTEEEWNRSELESVKLGRVPITPLGLERLNAHRRAQGRSTVFAEFYDALDLARDPEAGATTSAISEPSAGTTAASLPSGVDNSNLKYFPPIRSQGSLNSCAQFSAVYYTLTHMTAMARNWDAKNGGDAYRFSPKWTYNMVNGGQNAGSWHYDAYGIAQKHGLATWAEFPYDANYRAWCVNPTTWYNAISFRANQAGKISGIHTSGGLDQIKQFLLNGYVLNFATYINSWVWGTTGNDPATAADDALAGKPCVTQVNGNAGGHSMTIVGYNDDLWIDINANGAVESSEKGALRIANSWGTSWREAGFGWVSYQALRTRNPSSTSEGLVWMDEATWVTARPSYTPRLIAQFNLTHAKGNQVVTSLGTSDLDIGTPSTTWTPFRLLYNSGGPYAFDGTTIPTPGTFCLDFTDLAPMTAGAKRYHFGIRDGISGDPLTVGSYTLIDTIRAKSIPMAFAPFSFDVNQYFLYVDYDVVAGSVPPQVVANASATTGAIPFVVVFDASQSLDPDGSISAILWNFGDGTSAAGPLAQHAYLQPGAYSASVTVQDNSGAQSSSTFVINAYDPNDVAAPSDLVTSSSGRLVTLRWTDNSFNETGFSVERALKPKSGNPIYSKIATVGPNASQYSESVSAGTYLYRILAINTLTGRSSDYSNVSSIRVR